MSANNHIVVETQARPARPSILDIPAPSVDEAVFVDEAMTMRKQGSFAVVYSSPTACVKEGTTVYQYDITFRVRNPVLNADGFLAIDNAEIDAWLAQRYSSGTTPAQSCERLGREVCEGIAALIRERGSTPEHVAVQISGSAGASMTVEHTFA